jgi:hypothetical protein
MFDEQLDVAQAQASEQRFVEVIRIRTVPEISLQRARILGIEHAANAILSTIVIDASSEQQLQARRVLELRGVIQRFAVVRRGARIEQ